MRRLKQVVGVAVTGLLLLVGLAACDEGADQRQTAIEGRWNNMEQAVTKYPDPKQINFPIRQALVKYTQRQDAVNHPWYIYIMGMNGNYVGYFVGQTYPVNACNFLSSTQQVNTYGSSGNAVIEAPSLDGVYYGNSQCDVFFFFDSATDSMQTFKAPMFFASDMPLDLDVPRLNSKESSTP